LWAKARAAALTVEEVASPLGIGSACSAANFYAVEASALAMAGDDSLGYAAVTPR
jgi:hypothetical protein